LAALITHTATRPGQILLAILILWTARVEWLGLSYAAGGARRHHVETAFVVLVALSVAYALIRCPRRGPQQVPPEKQRNLSPALCVAILIPAAVVLFAPALRLGFLSDDFVLIARATRRAMASWSEDWYFRPLPLLLWRGMAWLVPSPAGSLHLLNVVLHGVNAVLVAFLGRRLGLAVEPAIVAALLFVAYPASPEAVAWCSGIQDVLLTTAALASVLALARGSHRRTAGVHALAWLAVGLATKETAVVMPVLWLAAAWSPREPRARPKAAVILAGLALSGSYALWHLLGGKVPAAYAQAPSQYVIKELLVRPFATLGAPWSGTLLERWPSLLMLSIGGLGLLLLVAAAHWSRNASAFQRALRLTVWILVSIAPVYGYMFVASDLQGSRYTYLSEVGWAILLADLVFALATLLPMGRIASWTVVVTMLLLSVLALRFHLGAWQAAAVLRDRVLESVAQARARDRCASNVFEGSPDSVQGAYVFRNGFPEAIAEASPDGLPSYDSPACRYEYSNGEFRRVP
jgi:hypothetical protein